MVVVDIVVLSSSVSFWVCSVATVFIAWVARTSLMFSDECWKLMNFFTCGSGLNDVCSLLAAFVLFPKCVYNHVSRSIMLLLGTAVLERPLISIVFSLLLQLVLYNFLEMLFSIVGATLIDNKIG